MVIILHLQPCVLFICLFHALYNSYFEPLLTLKKMYLQTVNNTFDSYYTTVIREGTPSGLALTLLHQLVLFF